MYAGPPIAERTAGCGCLAAAAWAADMSLVAGACATAAGLAALSRRPAGLLPAPQNPAPTIPVPPHTSAAHPPTPLPLGGRPGAHHPDFQHPRQRLRAGGAAGAGAGGGGAADAAGRDRARRLGVECAAGGACHRGQRGRRLCHLATHAGLGWVAVAGSMRGVGRGVRGCCGLLLLLWWHMLLPWVLSHCR